MSRDGIRVWGRKTSSNVQALMWGLAELGLEVAERVDIGHRFGGTDTPEFRAMNPNGTVPVLQDGDLVIFETGAILRYLAGQYGRAPFWPDDPRERALVDMWAEWAKLNVALAFTAPVFWQVTRVPPSQRDPARLRQGLEALAPKLTIADACLAEQAYLCGAELTLADVQLGHVLYRYYDIEIPRPDLPALRRYYDQLRRRPAFQEHVMLDYSDLIVTG